MNKENHIPDHKSPLSSRAISQQRRPDIVVVDHPTQVIRVDEGNNEQQQRFPVFQPLSSNAHRPYTGWRPPTRRHSKSSTGRNAP